MLRLVLLLAFFLSSSSLLLPAVHGFVSQTIATTSSTKATTCTTRREILGSSSSRSRAGGGGKLWFPMALNAAMANEPPKRKRKRKRQPESPEIKMPDILPADVSDSSTTAPTLSEDDDDDEEPPLAAPPSLLGEMTKARISEKERSLMDEIAKLEMQQQRQESIEINADFSNTADKSSDSIPLPDIQDVLRQKALKQELERMEQEEESSKEQIKIKRSDKAAFAKLLEQRPFADADDSFFEEEEYGTVSALLGERAQPFLGIPSGPLQVGHFVGALGIALMAFVEYPGFPLTNLPTPLRNALQGGLAATYTINAALAAYAALCANQRGQPVLLWVTKTLSVGGLALDQLTQLPTLQQIQEAEARKGARALKKNKRRT